MELSFSIKREERPSFSDIGDKPFRLNFTTRNREKKKLEVPFKIKIIETTVEIFMLNDEDVEVKEIEKTISVESGEHSQSINLRFSLKKRPVNPTNVKVTVLVENTDIPAKSISITCH